MRHAEFRDRLQDALRGTGLLLQHAGLPSETMDLASASRRWEAYIRQPASQNSERFPISAKVTLEWDPINAARVNVRGKVSSPNLSGENRDIRKPSCGGRASISGCMPRFPTAPRLQCRTCRSSALGQAQAGVVAALPYLKQLASGGKGSRSEALALAERMLKAWQSDSRRWQDHFAGGCRPESSHRIEMIAALGKLKAAGLLERFIADTVTSSYDG